MNCQEYKEMIEDALDVSLQGELKANVRRHLEHCSECRDYLARRRREHAALFTGVNAAYSHLRRPPADFAERIVREVALRRAARRGWRRFSLPRWAFVAASLVVAAGFVFASAKLIVASVESEDGGEMAGAPAAPQAAGAKVGDVASGGSTAPSVSSVAAESSNAPRPETGQQGVSEARQGMAAAAAPLSAANGDEYQFIDPATYPAENVSYPARSSAMEIETGALRDASAADGLEARSRMKCPSNVIALESTKFWSLIISIR